MNESSESPPRVIHSKSRHHVYNDGLLGVNWRNSGGSYTTPCRMTGVTLRSGVGWRDLGRSICADAASNQPRVHHRLRLTAKM